MPLGVGRSVVGDLSLHCVLPSDKNVNATLTLSTKVFHGYERNGREIKPISMLMMDKHPTAVSCNAPSCFMLR